MPNEYIIYLKTDPETAHERIIQRNRLGENIDINYINKCHNYHEYWLNNIKNILLTLTLITFFILSYTYLVAPQYPYIEGFTQKQPYIFKSGEHVYDDFYCDVFDNLF
mgnify:CR=1 FL=1